jgi:uncharacterized protein (UPF0333 family)
MWFLGTEREESTTCFKKNKVLEQELLFDAVLFFYIVTLFYFISFCSRFLQ